VEQAHDFGDKVDDTGELIKTLQNRLQELEDEAEEIREERFGQLAEKIDVETSDVDVEELQEFLKKPYLVNEQGEDEYQVIVPEFLDFQVGRLDRRVNNYNVFVVDKYTKWMHGVPEFLKEEIDLDDDDSKFQVRGDILEFEEEEKDRVEADDDLNQHLENVEDDKATIKQGSEFELIADLIEKGELPFTPQPVQDEDLRDPEVGFELRGYQEDGLDRFMEQGHACFCWMTGAGKSFPSMEALDSLRYSEEDAKKAVVVQSRLTKQQWEEYFEEYAPRLLDEVEVVTYHSIDKLEGEYQLVVFDECLTGDTEVETKDGRTTFSEIDDVFDLDSGWERDVDLSVKSFDPDQGEYLWDEVKGIYKTYSEVKSIETSRGRVLKATSNHRHLVFDKDSFEVREQRDISEGDFLIQPLKRPERVYEDCPREELIGWYIGDGHINEYGNGKFSFASNADEQISIISGLCDKLGFEYSVFENSRGDITIYIPDFKEDLEWNGECGNKTETVRVPDNAYNWDEGRTSSLLRGLFDAEGSVSKKSQIQFNTVSEGLADDVERLLQKLGIDSTRQNIEKKNSCHNTQYRIHIPAHYNSVFSQQIGFRMDHKQKRVESIGNPDTALPVSDILESIKEDLNLTHDELAGMAGVSRQTMGGAIRGEHRLGQTHLNELSDSLWLYSRMNGSAKMRKQFSVPYSEIAEATDRSVSYISKQLRGDSSLDSELKRSIEEIIQTRKEKAAEWAEKLRKIQHLNVVEVDNVEQIGTRTVYDFETETHSFIANGFLTHNCHKLPADTFSKGATIPMKYRIGTTASPYREDGRQNYVFALTGPPVGLDWEKTAELMEKTYHEVNVHIVDEPREKIQRMQEVLDDVGEKRTLIFSDSLDFGDEIAEATGLEFVNGEDGSNQLDRIHDALDEDGKVVVSRVADHGFSRDDLQVVLEADFLYGSRRQQLQRTGRLFHGEGQRHDIFFTRGEFNKHQKRLFSLVEKGFELNFVDQEERVEVPEKYQSRVDLDMEDRGEKVQSGDDEPVQSSVSADGFLEHSKIQKEIEKAVQDNGRVRDETLKEVLIEIDLAKDGLTNEEISERLGNPITEPHRLTSGFRNHEPPILVQDDEKRNQFNTELLDELKEVEERRKRREKRKEQLNF